MLFYILYFIFVFFGIRFVNIQSVQSKIPGYPVDRRMALMHELKERRAEVLARFHIVQASRDQSRGDSKMARRHLHTLMNLLRERGPNSEFVRALYQEADQLHHEFTLSPRPAEKSAPAPQG